MLTASSAVAPPAPPQESRDLVQEAAQLAGVLMETEEQPAASSTETTVDFPGLVDQGIRKLNLEERIDQMRESDQLLNAC